MSAQGSEFLLIDISNSFTKIARSSADRLGEVHRVPTADLNADSILPLVGAGDCEVCVLSSVVPGKNPVIEALFPEAGMVEVGPETNLGVRIDLPLPITTGADRLANAAYAAELGELPAVVVDLGTAVTFDVVTGERVFIGGVIAPGLEVMASYLHDRTALLPRIDLCEPVTAIGKTTTDAMQAGAVIGFRGMVRGILESIRREIAPESPLKVLATGGYASHLAASVPEIHEVHPNLTMEGLRILGRLNR